MTVLSSPSSVPALSVQGQTREHLPPRADEREKERVPASSKSGKTVSTLNQPTQTSSLADSTLTLSRSPSLAPCDNTTTRLRTHHNVRPSHPSRRCPRTCTRAPASRPPSSAPPSSSPSSSWGCRTSCRVRRRGRPLPIRT